MRAETIGEVRAVCNIPASDWILVFEGTHLDDDQKKLSELALDAEEKVALTLIKVESMVEEWKKLWEGRLGNRKNPGTMGFWRRTGPEEVQRLMNFCQAVAREYPDRNAWRLLVKKKYEMTSESLKTIDDLKQYCHDFDVKTIDFENIYPYPSISTRFVIRGELSQPGYVD